MTEVKEFIATGRRKTAVASVRLRSGQGRVVVNARSFDDYFSSEFDRSNAIAPLTLIEKADLFNVFVRVKGGGVKAQAEAIRLGIARAILELNGDYKKQLKAEGYLTRDPREKERKKYGLRGARERPQYSKR